MERSTGRAAHWAPAWGLLALWLVWLAALAGGPAAAQGSGENPVSANLREGVLRFGASTTLTLVVTSAQPVRVFTPTPPEGVDLIGPSGPSVSNQLTIVQGRRSSLTQQTWRWQVRPTRTGEFAIPPVVVELDGRRYESGPLQLVVVEDIAGAAQGFLELSAPAERVVEGQPFGLEVLFGWDASLARTNYASLSLPWWESLSGVLQERIPPARDAGSVVVNGQHQVPIDAVSDVVREGRPYKAYRLRLELVATRPGPLELAGNFLEYAEVEQDFFGGSRKLASAFARGSDLKLEVRELPTEGQPFDFGGAIGNLAVRASADTRAVRVGESIKLTVDWTGNGNLAYFEAPDPRRLAAFAGFRCFGWVEEKVPGRRRVVYDLAPLSADVDQIPPLELPLFDPESWSYTRLATAPIPLQVEPLAPGLEDEEPKSQARTEVHGIRQTPFSDADIGGSRAPRNSALATVAGAVVLSWFALRTAARRGGVDPGARPERRRRRALSQLQGALVQSLDPEGDLAAWVDFAAARSGEEREAWIGRDVRAWAENSPAGQRLSPYVVEELVQTAKALEGAAYGGLERVPRAKLLERARGLLEEGL